jgi:uncharacterized protein YukE
MPPPLEPGLGVAVSPHMLNTVALSLSGKAEALANLRNAFNSACNASKNALGKGFASQALNEFFQAWFSAFDAQAETMSSVADATQQCAVIYDHVDRQVQASILAMPTAPPPSPPSKRPGNPFLPFIPNQRPPMA